MKIVVVGGTGTLGSALHKAFGARGHDVVTVARSGGDLRYDITEPDQVSAMYDELGQVDAVVSAAGKVPYGPVAELAAADYESAFRGKVLCQVQLVRQGLSRVSERGSFTLITGILVREPIPTGAAASMANGAVEAFVRAAAIEIAPFRINAVSPTVFTESLDTYESYFPGMPSVDLVRVTQAYVRSVEGAQTGEIYVP